MIYLFALPTLAAVALILILPGLIVGSALACLWLTFCKPKE